jgi:hypothetical protein
MIEIMETLDPHTDTPLFHPGPDNRTYCKFCRVDHLPLHLEGCNPFAPGPDPATEPIDWDAIADEGRRSLRRKGKQPK